MTKNKLGFTLIELVVVIVILGVLAVTAGPRFLGIASDARSSTIRGVEAAMRSGAELVHSRAVIEGVDQGTVKSFQITDVDTIGIRAGYPRVAGRNNCSNFIQELQVWMDFDLSVECRDSPAMNDADWEGEVDSNMFHMYPTGFNGISDGCYVTYITASVYDEDEEKWLDADSAIVLSETSGC